MRINKYLAQCGVTSRRNADKFIAEGRVEVNGVKLESPGFKVDEVSDVITVDGRIVRLVKLYTYIVMNKPVGFLTSHKDPHHNKTVMHLLADVETRVNPVGRLDLDTSGVLLFTDDGELAHRLTHPKFGVGKTYNAIILGKIGKGQLQQFSDGLELPDGTIGRAKVRILSVGDTDSEIELILTEGRKREVKNLCKAAGHPVRKLTRVSFGDIACDDVRVGKWRNLTSEEVAHLKKLVDLHP